MRNKNYLRQLPSDKLPGTLTKNIKILQFKNQNPSQKCGPGFHGPAEAGLHI